MAHIELTDVLVTLRKQHRFEDQDSEDNTVSTSYISIWKFGRARVYGNTVYACVSNGGKHQYFTDEERMRDAIAAWRENGYKSMSARDMLVKRPRSSAPVDAPVNN